jgi:hypothetical protein
MLTFGAQGASATTVSPEIHSKAPVTSTSTADGSFKVAQRRNRGRGGRGRGRGFGRGAAIGIGLGALALGVAAAAASEGRSCRRVENRCARRHGWETRRWFNCVEDRGC